MKADASFALDDAGSAGRGTLHRAVALGTALVAAGCVVVLLADIRLGAWPSFTTVQATWVVAVDSTTSWILLEQFRAVRRPIYAVLGCAYLTSALVVVPFALAFPGALRPGDPILGGAQSAVWLWHVWHLVLPAMAIVAVARGHSHGTVPAARVPAAIAAAVAGAGALAVAVTVVVTTLADRLPVLLRAGSDPLTSGFYAVGGLVAGVTAAAAALCWRTGWRERRSLDLWLAVALTALLADSVASLFAGQRFTVGWYFGRVESMVASSVLLMVFVTDLSGLFRRLRDAQGELSEANRSLRATLGERDALVADLRRTQERVRRMAFHDGLTGLPNRRLLADRAGRAIAMATRHDRCGALLFLDLDGFKEINDRFGHEAGDGVLRAVAARLAGGVRDADTVARVGGDEFVVLLPEVAHARDAARIAENVLTALREPVTLPGGDRAVSASIGIAVFPGDGADFAELLRAADTAMYTSKARGGGVYRYRRDLPAAAS